jgi:hypothetical protein
MNGAYTFRITLMFGLALSLATVLSAQATSNAPNTSNKTLIVNGKAVPSGVRQINGRSYIDVETLAQATNGVVTVEPNRVVLTIPVRNANTAPAEDSASNSQALSRNFALGAIGEVSEMREWRGAIGAMVTYGLAISGKWAQDYHDRAQAGLRQVAELASTDGDRNALQLLTKEFNNLSEWANEIFTARQNLNGAKTIDPNALNNDPQLAKITDCSRSLEGMLISGSFSDDGSCQ